MTSCCAIGKPSIASIRYASIAVGLEELRQVPDVILLADGAKRAAATSAALKTGLFNGIVTDASVAGHLLA